MIASIGCSFSGFGFVFRKPLSQILGSSLLLLQEVSHTHPFGGLGLNPNPPKGCSRAGRTGEERREEGAVRH